MAARQAHLRPRHPASVCEATSRELGRCASEVFAEVCGVRLPDDKAARLASVLNDPATDANGALAALGDAFVMMVSEQSLRRFGVRDPAGAIARLRRRPDTLFETAMPGVWDVAGYPNYVRPNAFIAPVMHVRPNTRISVGPVALPEEIGAVKRPYGYTFNVPPDEEVPPFFVECGMTPTRWQPRSPLWMVDWKPAFAAITELAYIAANPGDVDYPLEEAVEFLGDICETIDVEDVRRELAGASLATWLRVGCLLAGGYRDDLTREVADAAARHARHAHGQPMSDADRAATDMLLRRVRAWRPAQAGVVATLQASLEPDADLLALLRECGSLNTRLRREELEMRVQRMQRDAEVMAAARA